MINNDGRKFCYSCIAVVTPPWVKTVNLNYALVLYKNPLFLKSRLKKNIFL